MNCIFVCVFNQEKYVDMLYLLLESIFIYGNLDDTTDILIYTSKKFKNIIQNSTLYCNKIKFEINDKYNTLELACKARLDVFILKTIDKYKKILYLDTDIIVKKDLNPIFDIIEKDIIYVLEEGSIDSDTDFWGKTLFGDEVNKYTDKSAFTTGIMLFNNCSSIKNLFSKIKKDFVYRRIYFYCHDQPYIIYGAFKLKLYDNKILKKCVVNNDTNIDSDKTIIHFCGDPGVYSHKLEKMSEYLYSLKKKQLNDNNL